MTDKKDEGEIDATKPFTPAETVELTSKLVASDAMVGQMLDNRFLIKKDLTDGGADAGGIGLVYLAQDSKLMNRQVVVKILQKAAIENPDILRKFQHEKEALIRLDHPNIVRILDSGTLSDGNPFMVMEYIAGYSLRRMLSERKPLSLAFCAHVIESNICRPNNFSAN
jgi:serine/threonine-protein kinase